jgi:hypothetical protein
MKIRFFFLIIYSMLLTACVTQQQDITPALAEPMTQYRCNAKILFSDATREFSTREVMHSNTYVLHLGEPLTQQLSATFWTDSLTLQAGRPAPTVTVGFGNGTGVQKNQDGKERLQVSLQFQIFRPSGNSYLDIVAGQSTARDPAKAAAESITIALLRLQSVLNNAGICQPIP